MPLSIRAAVLVLAFAFGAAAASQVQMWRYEKRLADIRSTLAQQREAATNHARMIETTRAENIALAAALEAERNQEAEVVTEVITEEVIRYVQKAGRTACGVDHDGVRLINAAATGRVPAPGDTTSTPDVSASLPGEPAGPLGILRGAGALGDPELCEGTPVCSPGYLPAGLDHCSADGARG